MDKNWHYAYSYLCTLRLAIAIITFSALKISVLLSIGKL